MGYMAPILWPALPLVAKDSQDLAYESKSYKYVFFMSIHREINRDPMLPLSL